jgi:hypothetical protein
MFLDIRMEGNQGNNYSATKLYLSPKASITDSFGLFNITGSGGNTNGSSGQFAFAGIVADSSMQAIQTKPGNAQF